MKTLTRVAALSTAAFLCAAAAQAATIEITDIKGVWQGVDPANTVGLTGEGSSSISWGTTINGGNQSGYDFTAVPVSFQPASSPFDIGTFTHRNFTIAGSPTPASITGASLAVTVTGTVDGNGFTIGGVYDFEHFETPNGASTCAAGGNNPCPDLVTFLGASQLNDTIELDGEVVSLGLTGFEDGFTFLTAEGQANHAILQAEFTSTPRINEIPLPATAWLLIAGMMGLFGIRRFT